MMPHKLMLVEDDASVSDMIVHYLEREGFTIVCAYDGDEALRLFQQQSFDLILLDLMLLRLNGMDLLGLITYPEKTFTKEKVYRRVWAIQYDTKAAQQK